MTSSNVRFQAERYLAESNEYSTPYEREKLIANWEKKERDADALVVDFCARAGDPHGTRLLELGFGSGLHIPAFVRAGAEVHGLEVSQTLLDIARENLRDRGVTADLQLYDGTRMPFPDQTFDYICATSVLEHVSDLGAVLREADRVLKPSGKFYLSFPNRLAPRETHTGFYFVSYLPRSLARRVLRAFGSDAVDELNLHFLSYGALQRAIRGTRFRVTFERGGAAAPRRLVKRVFAALGIHHSAVLKTVMVVLEKHV